MSLTNDTGTTMLVQPANGCYNGNSGWGNGFGDGSWWIVLFLIFGMFGWGGFGGFGGGFGGGMNGGVGSEVQRGFDHSSVVQKLDGITQGICDSTYALNNTMTNGFHGVDSALCNLGNNVQQGFNQTNIALMQGQNALAAQLASCCCDNREAISALRYDMATQDCATRNLIQSTTRDIIDSQNAGTRQILDFLTNDKIATLTAENQSLKFAASQSAQNAFITANQEAQTAELIRRLGADCPQPAYVVQPPQPVTFPVNSCGTATYGYNNGCGGCC